MTIVLSAEAQSYVTELMARLRAQRPDEIVNWLLLKQRADEAYDLQFPPRAEDALADELLQAVRAPHRPYEPGEFRRRAERLVSESEAR